MIMRSTRWGIVGFGEVGSTFAHRLDDSLQSVRVTDPVFATDPLPTRVSGWLNGRQIDITPDVPELVVTSDIVISLVTPGAAAGVASEAARAAHPFIFLDFNSISPTEKCRLADQFPAGCYVDGAIMGSIAAERAQTPLVLSGPAAQLIVDRLTSAGFNASVVGPEVGAASALKMCRSIFMKGVECLFLETVLAADNFGIREAVLRSIEETFSSLGFKGTADMLLTTHAVHSDRRASEMSKVVDMLAEACLPHGISSTSRDVLNASAASGLVDHVHGQVPATPDVVVAYLSDFYHKRCS